MFSSSKRLASRALALFVVAVSVALGHACSDDGAGPSDEDVTAPTNLVVEILSYNRIRVTWAPIPGAAGYAVERRVNLTGEFTHLADVPAAGGNTVSYIDASVQAETFYGYRVRALGTLGSRSAPSDVSGARTPSEPGIEVTVNMVAPDAASADPNGFRLRLTGPQNVTENITPGTTALITPLTPGTYTVTLEDVAQTCAVEGGPARTVNVSAQGTETVVAITLTVRCRDATRGGIVVRLTAAGDTLDDNGVIVRVVGTSGGGASIQDTLSAVPGQTSSTDALALLSLVPGSYEISLLDVNTNICTLSGAAVVTRNVTAARNDTINFSLNCARNRPPRAEANGPYTGMAQSPISFSSAGSTDPDGTIASYAWNFGDGGVGTGATATHAYATPGIYTVRLTVTDNNGATNTDSASVTVVPGFAWKNRFSDDSLQAGDQLWLDITTKPGPAVSAAAASISYNATALRLDTIIAASHWTELTRNGTTPGTAAFQVTTTAPSDAALETDVVTLRFTVIGSPGTVVRTTTRNIALKNGSGAAIPLTNLSVIEDTVKILAGGNRPPVAKVNVLPAPTATTRDTLVFTAQPGTFDPDGSIVSYEWRFGDGTLATTSIARKRYAAPGSYTVSLIVLDNNGISARDSMTVVITESANVVPTADAGGPYSGVVGSAVLFDGSKSTDTDGTIVRYDWNFGDGVTSSGASATAFRTYSNPGSYIVGLTVFDNRGGVAFDTALVTIAPPSGTNRPPVARANGPYTGIVGQPVTLSAAGSSDPDNNIRSYTWYYPDQTTSTGLNTFKTFSTAGVHNVTLVVEDSLGLNASATTTVTVSSSQTNQPPVAEANGPYTARINQPVVLSSAGTRDPDGQVVSYRWHFGDGTSSTDTTLAFPVHIYTTLGTFTVTLQVRDDRGASAVDVTAVTVINAAAPVAEAGGPYSGTTGTPITFNGAGSVDVDGTITSYSWDFGDGATANGLTTSTTTHAYTTAGVYKVKLTVTDSQGLTNTDSATATVTGATVNAPPVAQANGPYTGVVNTPIGFSAAGSTDADGTIATYAWNFGDGTTGTGASITHAYTTTGQFQVVLTVTDNLGATAADTAQVTVNAVPGNIPPVAEANGPYSGAADNAINFSSAGSLDPDGSLVTFAWDFGDGGTAFGPTVTHTYAGGGTFVVRLTVTDNLGATASDSAVVTVSGASSNVKPVAEANGPYTGTAGTAINFSAAGSQDADGSIVSYSWSFGDGGTGTGTTPAHTYTTAGSYKAILTVTDNLGATDADTADVTVLAQGANTPPTANPGGPYSGAIGTPITLNGSGTDNGSITAYAWDLDDDGAFDDADVANPQFTCTAAGTFTIRLRVTDNGTPPLTGTASTTVTCGSTEPPPTPNTIRGRWVNASGATITSASAGATVFLEIDVLMGSGLNISDVQAVLLFDPARLTAPTNGADLNCSNPGGQTTCPSGTPAAGNLDVMTQYTGSNLTPGQLAFLNFTNSTNGTGLQGLARLQFTTGSAGLVTPTLVLQIAAGNNGSTDIEPQLSISIPPLTIN